MEIQLSLPEGGFGRFLAVESPIMEPGLAAQFPDIKTYIIQAIDDPTASGRIDMTHRGLRATVLSEKGRYFIDPAITPTPKNSSNFNAASLAVPSISPPRERGPPSRNA